MQEHDQDDDRQQTDGQAQDQSPVEGDRGLTIATIEGDD
jgi:hypothetical protein